MRRIADPERWPVDLGDHLTLEHAATLFKRIDPAKASALPRDPETDAMREEMRAGRRADRPRHDVVCRG